MVHSTFSPKDLRKLTDIEKRTLNATWHLWPTPEAIDQPFTITKEEHLGQTG